MNLIHDKFIPVSRKSGRKEQITPWQITETEDPVLALNTPRPDFNGSLMQFLIGLLQTTAMPDDFYKWLKWLEKPPEPEELKRHCGKKAFAFKIEGQQAFIQDLDRLVNRKEKSIVNFLIDAPEKNALDRNNEPFIT